MKKIGVISDTHIPTAARALPAMISDLFDGVDMILHAGDLVSESVLDDLALIAPVMAVRGNMDLSSEFNPLKRIVDIEGEGVLIGLIHGWGAPGDLPMRVLGEFEKKPKPDCIVFGHSHQPFNEFFGGVLMFNPGSPTDKRFAPYFSVGILTVSGGAVSGEIIKL
ncbi:MAG: metallophosphoesterase family protein [bacterium]